jgi:Uncharacterized conserved protein
MCGRYSVLTEDEIVEIRSALRDISLELVKDGLADYKARLGEILPTDMAPAIMKSGDGAAFESAKFGFKKWDGAGVIINARAETLQAKSMFSRLLDAGRCVVPAKEYYEWRETAEARDGAGKKQKSNSKKAKHFIKDKEGNLLFFAGLYRTIGGEKEFVIITKNATGDVAEIHDRMPVILRAAQLEPWLNGTLSPDDIIKIDFNAEALPCGET